MQNESNIGIIGAGNASLTILDYFHNFDGYSIRGICDLNPDAPGLKRAGQLGITCFNDTDRMLDEDLDLIIELTGNKQVQELVYSRLKDDQNLVNSSCAKLMCDLIDNLSEKKRNQAEKLNKEFNSIRAELEGSVTTIEKSNRTIVNLLSEAQLVNFNAKIEAAKAGKYGATFSVVVDRLSELVQTLKKTSKMMSDVSVNAKSAMVQLDKTEKKLVGSEADKDNEKSGIDLSLKEA